LKFIDPEPNPNPNFNFFEENEFMKMLCIMEKSIVAP